MYEHQLRIDPTINSLQPRFEAAGMPFTPLVDDAITKATHGIRNPVYQTMVQSVLHTLIDKLLEAEARRKPKHLAGRLLQSFLSLFQR